MAIGEGKVYQHAGYDWLSLDRNDRPPDRTRAAIAFDGMLVRFGS
jgi:hypothetical protein